MSGWAAALGPQAQIFIYGAGRYGRRVLDDLSRARPDVKVLGFVDSYRAGRCRGLDVWLLPCFRTERPPCDTVVVASGEFWREMESIMLELGYRTLVPARESIWRFDDEERRRLNLVRERIVEGAELFDRVVGALEAGDERPLAEHFRTFVEGRRRLYFDYAPVTEGETVLEGGVFDGADTVRFAERVGPSGRVYGFDPWGERQLDGCSAVRRHPAVRLVPKALWSGQAVLHFHRDYGDAFAGAAFVDRCEEAGTEAVEAVSIDEFVDVEGVERIDFIKLDIEGSEPEALAGAETTLRRWRPRLAVSAYHHPTHLYRLAEQVLAVVPDYHLYFEHYSPTWSESVFYFVPEDGCVP